MESEIHPLLRLYWLLLLLSSSLTQLPNFRPRNLQIYIQELAESNYHTIWYFTFGRAKQVVETAINALEETDKSRFMVYDVEQCELEYVI